MESSEQQILVNLITSKDDFKALLKACIKEVLPLEEIKAQLQLEREEKLLSVPEVAQLFQVSKVTIYDWKKRGVLPYIKLNSRVRFKKSDVLQLYKSKRMRNGNSTYS